MNHVHPAFSPAQLTRRPSRKRTLLSAYHEPGHALPELYFGGHIVDVMIRSEYEATVSGFNYIDSKGFSHPGVGRGVCVSQLIFDPELDVVGDCGWRMRAEMRMAVLVGGIYPLQRRLRWSGGTAVLGAGENDYTQASRIAELLEDRRLAFHTAEQRARALARSSCGWQFIDVLAKRLLDEGVVLGSECHELFASIFGRAPVDIADWYAHWPPTLEQLRAGWLPPCQ
jgi:hypothetical protein